MSDEISSVSQFGRTASSNKKTFVQIIVLASQTYKYDHLSGRSPAAIESELASERNKHGGFYHIGEEHTFESMLEHIRTKARCIPAYNGLCTYIVGNNRPMLIENQVNALEGLSMLSSVKVPSIYCILTTCPTSVPDINDDKNALTIMMKSQRKQQSSSLCSFSKTVNQGGYDNYYQNNKQLQ